MKGKIKKIVWFLIIIAVIVGAYYFFLVRKKSDKKMEEAKQEEISKSDLIIKELADKYQAITGGEEEELTYTIQAQERFITDKPTLFINVYVDDVFNRDGKTFIRFWSAWFSHNNYVLELECNKKIVDKILAQKREDDLMYLFDGEYAVVANIKEVTKSEKLELEGYIGDDDINIDSSDVFIAKGVCVDVVYIND